MKKEKGSATLIVLITMIFLITILSSIFNTSMVKHKSQLQDTKKMQNIYDGNINVNYIPQSQR